MAKGEAVEGRGFLRTDDDEVADADDRALDRVDSELVRGL